MSCPVNQDSDCHVSITCTPLLDSILSIISLAQSTNFLQHEAGRRLYGMTRDTDAFENRNKDYYKKEVAVKHVSGLEGGNKIYQDWVSTGVRWNQSAYESYQTSRTRESQISRKIRSSIGHAGKISECRCCKRALLLSTCWGTRIRLDLRKTNASMVRIAWTGVTCKANIAWPSIGPTVCESRSWNTCPCSE